MRLVRLVRCFPEKTAFRFPGQDCMGIGCRLGLVPPTLSILLDGVYELGGQNLGNGARKVHRKHRRFLTRPEVTAP